jgi:hypothetical protein
VGPEAVRSGYVRETTEVHQVRSFPFPADRGIGPRGDLTVLKNSRTIARHLPL